MLDENKVVSVDKVEIDVTVGAVLHPVSEAVNSHEHWGTRLEVLLHSGGGSGGSQLSPESLEDRPGNGRVLETELGKVFKGGSGLETGNLVLLRDLEAGENLAIGLNGTH